MFDNSVEYYGKEEKDYPKRLKYLERMPKGLYVKGKLPQDDAPTIAIAGARLCSAYGREQAFEYARVLSAHGIQVISGLACGIDSSAHEGALRGGGTTFAVLGCGVDICYPKENYLLYRKILQQEGGILSEFPNGTAPLAWHFPVRNRIISALSDAVLIIEARKKSGSLITADYALEQGKTVFALPGRVGDALSWGCNYLLYQGAGVAYSPQCILDEFGITPKREKQKKENKDWNREQKTIYEHLEAEGKSIGELQRETGYSMAGLSQILLQLQEDGAVEEFPRNYWRRRGESL